MLGTAPVPDELPDAYGHGDADEAAWRPDRPNITLPNLPPRADVETKAVLKQCITARASLAELRQAAELIPNQSVLIGTLPLLEAGASSEIENIVTTADRLFQHVSDDAHADTATKEALRYSRALFDGFRALSAHPLTTRTAELICSRIKGVEMTVRRLPGTALANQASTEVVYTPPEGEPLLRQKLTNWERFMHEATDLDPLIRMAIGHYQFEAIHPFTDGNGRTGRVLNSLFLNEQDLLTLPILYLSRYINNSKSEYYRLLQRVTSHGHWESWLLYMLRGVHETAQWTTAKIAAIRALRAHTVEYVTRELPKIYSRELVEMIFDLPYCRISNVIERSIAKRQTASVYLKQLTSIGVLTTESVSKEKLFVHPKLMLLLTQDRNEFARYPGFEIR
ncbi:protein adenylyltransferase Fic [Gemmatimonas sp.]|uniref:protein adenylyltransferase Fic n=1 Tax=Gemmatimonas sp. TaxID=1962908 RepID=UPI00398340D8